LVFVIIKKYLLNIDDYLFFLVAQEEGWSTNPIDSAEYEGEDLATMIEARSGANKIPGSRKGGRKRMINSMAIRDFWDFEHYGCWCIEKKGYGPAVDEVDFACLGIYRFYCVLRLQQCW